MTRQRAAALLVALLAAGACSGGGDDAATTTSRATSSSTSSTTRAPAIDDVCDDAPIPTPQTPGFTRASSSVKAVGTPGHGISDGLSIGGTAASIGGRFQYGRLNVDLNLERVELWLDDCSGTARLIAESTTDDNGIIELQLPALDLEPGRYALHAVVAGDGTFASGVLSVVAPDAEVAVFDIDGTLTVADSELLRDAISELFPRLAAGDYIPEARAGATEATEAQASRGRLVLYLTGRPVWLARTTRAWLVEHAVAPGVLLMPAQDAGAVPNEAGVGTTKVNALQLLLSAGVNIVDAYGNAETDVYAYRAVGIPDARIHILGPEAPPGVDALGETFEGHKPSGS